jgi:hypothetical protein
VKGTKEEFYKLYDHFAAAAKRASSFAQKTHSQGKPILARSLKHEATRFSRPRGF